MIIRGVELVGEDSTLREIGIRGELIAHVGPACAGPPRDAVQLDFDDAIAFPGLINSHDHLEFNVYPALGYKRYVDYMEWGKDIQRRDGALIAAIERMPKASRLRWGALKNLLCGVTTVAHHGSAGDDLGRLPIATLPGTAIHSIRRAAHWRLRLNAPLGHSPYVFHVGEGTSREAAQEIDELTRWNLLRRPLIGVHAIAMRPDQAKHFHAVVWCPASNDFLYGVTADVAALKRHTTMLFGSDSTLTAEWNFWNHVRRARAAGAMGDRDLFSALTEGAAVAWRRPETGRLAAGRSADLVVARRKAKDPWDAFFSVDPEDILLVVRAGAVVLCDASLGAAPRGSAFSIVRLGRTEKIVAEDVPHLLRQMRTSGVPSNLPITEAAVLPS